MDYRNEFKKQKLIVKIFTIISIITICIISWVYFSNESNPPETLKKPIYITDTVKIETFSEAHLMLYMDILEIEHSDIVFNQARHETGNFTSPRFKQYNALFGFQTSDKNIIKYKSWKESVVHYKMFQMRKLKEGEDYYDFLIRVGYATDSNYINKLKQY